MRRDNGKDMLWQVRLVLVSIALAGCGLAQEPVAFLAKEGAAQAVIVVPDTVTPVERSAAEELRLHLDQVTGAHFIVTNESAAVSGSRLLVGNTAALSALLPGFDPKSVAYDGIVLKTAGSDLILTGHPQRGALYAVYSYLEDTVGVRWWTSTETFIPKRPTLSLPALDVRYAPALRFRESYYLDSFNARFKARLKGNFSSRTRYMLAPLEMIPESYGGNHRLIFFKGRNSAYHSFYELLPPKVYFAEHPEWYSEIKGKRTHEEAQLCLTNGEMREELTKNALALLREDPGADIIQVSQNDAAGRCTCATCLAVEREEGGIGTASGPLLRFVNRVAEDIEVSGVALGCYQENVTQWLDFEGAVEATRLMNEALAAATSEETRDPVGNAGLRDKVLREKLSLDHVWLINYDKWMSKVEPASPLFVGPRDPLSLWRQWDETCRRFNVKAHRETTSEETFRKYVAGQMIVELAGVDYETACVALFESLEEMKGWDEARRKTTSPAAYTVGRLRKRQGL